MPPKKQDKYEVKRMVKAVEKYIKSNSSVPILKECCIQNDWDYDYVMKLQRKKEYKALRQSIKKLLDLKEIRLEIGMLSGLIPKSAAIFSLKQLGWRDNPTNDELNKKKTNAYVKDVNARVEQVKGDNKAPPVIISNDPIKRGENE